MRRPFGKPLYATTIVPLGRACGEGLEPLMTQPMLCHGPAMLELQCSSVRKTAPVLAVAAWASPAPAAVWPMENSRNVPSLARTTCGLWWKTGSTLSWTRR